MKLRNLLAATAVAAAVFTAYGMSVEVQAAGATADVSTSGELKDALQNASVDTIVFQNDIIAEEAMPVNGKRTEAELVIEGNGYQFTERYVKTAKTTNGIYFTESKATVDTITVQNLNIVGQSKYGTIYSNKEVRQNFVNVAYTGPMMVNNSAGSVRFEDADISITPDAYGTAMGEVAEANSVYFAGDIRIERANGSTSDILALKKTGGEVVVEENAVVEIVNNHDDGGKGNTKASVFIDSVYKYDFHIKDGAEFKYSGTFSFDKSCKLTDFVMGEGAKFQVDILGDSGKYITKAYYGSVTIADNAEYKVNIAGEGNSKVLYGKNGVTIGNNADISIDIGGKLSTASHLIKSLCGAVVIGEDTSVDINVGAESRSYIFYSKNSMQIGASSDVQVNIAGKNYIDMVRVLNALEVAEDASFEINVDGEICGSVIHATKNINVGKRAEVKVDINGDAKVKAVKSACAGMTLDEDSLFSVQSNGKISYALLYICKDLIVENNATLDLIALNNTNTTTCEELLYIYGGTLAFRNPNRVLVYNDSQDLKKSKPVFLGSGITMEIDVYSTKYWIDPSTSGGHMVLENPDYDWAQPGNYQISAKTALGKFKTFAVENYEDQDNMPNASNYFFCSKAHRAYLWQGSNAQPIEEVTLTYDMNDPYPVGDGREADAPQSELFEKSDEVTVADYMFSDVEWEFIAWNTEADGSGTEYMPGSEVTLTEDTVLYARWKSLIPEGDKAIAGETEITGRGIPGSLIEIELPDGSTATGTVTAAGTWKVYVPFESLPLVKGQVIKVRQTEPNKIVSDDIELTVTDGRRFVEQTEVSEESDAEETEVIEETAIIEETE